MRGIIPFLRQVHMRFWWMDMLYPLALAGILFTTFTLAIYADRKHRRIASLWENELLEISLKVAGSKTIENPEKLTIISLVESDLPHLKGIQQSPLIDASSADYADVISAAGRAGAKLIVLSWTPAAHPANDAYYEPMIKAIKALPQTTKVILGFPQGKAWNLPEGLTNIVTTASDLSCQEPIEMICPYVPSVQDWIVQQLVDAVNPDKALIDDPYRLSSNLTLPQSSYILNLPGAEQLATYSFHALLAADSKAQTLKDQVVFIGNSVVQTDVNLDQVDLIRRVYTVMDDRSQPLRVAGTPMHVFWGQITQQFLDSGFVRVATFEMTSLIAGVVALLVWAVLLWFGAVPALTGFMLLAALAPAANGLAIHYVHFYLPLFNTLYAGLASFLFAGFGKLSYATYARWRVEEELRMRTHTSDLKENFISLFSHNLNTPIAKMQGMLEILAAMPAPDRFRSDIQKSLGLITQLQMAVKCVLVSTAIRENSVNHEALTITALQDEFLNTFGTSLKRLRIQLKVERPSGSEDAVFVPLRFDRRAFTTALAALVALYADPEQNVPITLSFEVDAEQDPASVRCRIQSAERSASPEVIRQLSGSSHNAESNRFFEHLLAKLARDVLNAYQGRVEVAKIGSVGQELTTIWQASST